MRESIASRASRVQRLSARWRSQCVLLLKRTIRWTYVGVEPFHLFRYLDEQAFRFNEREGTDADRFREAIHSIVGRRLTYADLIGENQTERL